jgi:hypothetical protein
MPRSAPVQSRSVGRFVLALAGALLAQACASGAVGVDGGGNAGVVGVAGLSTQCVSDADCTPVFFGDVCAVKTAEGPSCNSSIATASAGAYVQELEAARGRCVQPPAFDGVSCVVPSQGGGGGGYKACLVVGCDAGTCVAIGVCVI